MLFLKPCHMDSVAVPKILYGQLRGLEAYVEGSFYVTTLRLLCPCHKSSDVIPTAPSFPRIVESYLIQ